MTISSVVGTNMTVDEVVKHAFQTAGLVRMGAAPTGAQYEFGRIALNTTMKGLMAEGLQARWVDFYNLTLTASTYIYSLPAIYVDVVGDGQYIAASETDLTKASSETLVQQIDRDTWHKQSAKSSSGRPYLLYSHRAVDGDQIELRLWPIPDEAGTVRLQVHALPADTLDGSSTLDVREYWMQALIWEVAHQLAVASALSEERCSYFRKTSKEKTVRARSYANEKPPVRLVLDHQTGWNVTRRL